MTNFLIRLFIKDYKNVSDEKVRNRYGFFSGLIGIISNLLLAGIKMFAGLISGSLSIVADAVNNLSDTLSSIITLIGFKLSNKAADDDHPFGHERIEYIAGLIISILIIVVGFNFIVESIDKIFNVKPVEISVVTIIILSCSIIIKIWQGFFYRKISKKISSTTLKASSTDSFNDCISTASVLVSALILYIFKINIDGYMGVFISLFIIKSGVGLVMKTSSPLIGSLPSREFVDSLVDVSLSNESILGYHDLIVHSYGPKKKFATIHLEFDYRDDILKIHDIVDNIENEALEKLGVHLVVHMDPIVSDDEETIGLKDIVQDILETISPDLSFHDLRLVKGPTHTNVLFDVVIPTDLNKMRLDIKNEIIYQFKNIDKKYNVVISFDLRMNYKPESF